MADFQPLANFSLRTMLRPIAHHPLPLVVPTLLKVLLLSQFPCQDGLGFSKITFYQSCPSYLFHPCYYGLHQVAPFCRLRKVEGSLKKCNTLKASGRIASHLLPLGYYIVVGKIGGAKVVAGLKPAPTTFFIPEPRLYVQ